jgi:hypothetical protein
LLPFWLSIGALSLFQAVLVGVSRPLAGNPFRRLGSRWWALLPPLSIGLAIAAVALTSATAQIFTYLALVAVPPLAAFALAALVPAARPPLSLAVIPLFALAWAARGSLSGQTAALLLSGLACLSLGWALASVVAPRWLRLGVYAMAAIDAVLVTGDLLQGPNATINAAAPAAGLPHLQYVSFGSAVMGFGDLFVAAILGAMLASNRPLQRRAALIAAALGIAFDLLFFAVDELPSTVPIALTLAVVGTTGTRRRSRR